MLIDELLEAAKAHRLLVPAKPVTSWAGAPRAFLMCAPLANAIASARHHADEKTIKRWAQLEADISHFIEGGYITWNHMKWLEPHKFGHWELRSRKPKPSLRVFGRFAKPDVFIGTHVVERASLKEKWNLKWELEKLACEEHWKAAGLQDQFCAFERYEDYITNNASRDAKV